MLVHAWGRIATVDNLRAIGTESAKDSIDDLRSMELIQEFLADLAVEMRASAGGSLRLYDPCM
jgi:hypothetical protein